MISLAETRFPIERTMVEVATNPFGYYVHAGEVLKSYPPDKNLVTPARYHIPGHNSNLDILRSYGSVVVNICQV